MEPGAQEHAAQRGFADEIEWRVGDVKHLAEPLAVYDAIHARVLFQFLADIPGTLRELRRVLKPGGRLLISVLGAANVLYVDAATFALSMVIIGLLVRLPVVDRAELPASGGAAAGAATASPAKQSYLSEVLAGLRFVVRDPFLRTVMPVAIL